MGELLRADFRRVLKDKLLIVMGILAVVFAVITPLLYTVIFSGMDTAESEMAEEMLAGYISGKAQFFGSFSMGNNLGLIAPILLGIVLCKDFSYGTVRNKIIAGKSRSAIFLSLFVTCSVVFVCVMLLNAFITLGVSLIFFDYQATAFTLSDFWYFLESLAFEILTLLFVSALLSWLCVNTKNVGLVIVLYVAVSLALVMAGSITQMVVTVLETTGGNDRMVKLLHFLSRINVGNSVTYIGMGTQYILEDVLYLTIPAGVGILGFIGHGLLRFNKKDLK